jgi:hypothetical protein
MQWPAHFIFGIVTVFLLVVGIATNRIDAIIASILLGGLWTSICVDARIEKWGKLPRRLCYCAALVSASYSFVIFLSLLPNVSLISQISAFF